MGSIIGESGTDSTYTFTVSTTNSLPWSVPVRKIKKVP